MLQVKTRALRALVLAGAGAAGLLAMAGPASAQWYGRPFIFQNPPVIVEEDNLSPREIAAIARRLGYRDVGRPRFTGDEYVVDATTRAGTRVRLVLDAFTGHMIDSYLAPETAPRRVVRTEEPRPPVPVPTTRPVLPPSDAESPQVAPRPPRASETPRATPSNPTVVRREPLLPPPASPQQTTPPPAVAPAPAARPAPQARPARPESERPTARAPAPAPGGVGTGTRQQPRVIPGAPPPPAILDDTERARRDEAPLNSVPPVGLD